MLLDEALRAPMPQKQSTVAVAQPTPRRSGYTCPLCLTSLTSSHDLAAHVDLCPENVQSCHFCGSCVQVQKLDEHILDCPQNCRRCYVCSLSVPVAQLPAHLFRCGEGKVIQMYHGTSHENAKSIMKGGFRPSTQGLLGAGVYVTKDMEKASQYGPIIVECDVHLGKLAVITRRGHPMQKSWSRQGYAAAWLPPFVSTSGLEEHCIADASRVIPRRLYSSPV